MFYFGLFLLKTSCQYCIACFIFRSIIMKRSVLFTSLQRFTSGLSRFKYSSSDSIYFKEQEDSKDFRITTPMRMDDTIRRKLVTRELKEAESERRRRLGRPVIACSRPAYNLYRGRQTLSKNTSLMTLASHGWKHYRSKGDEFIVNAFSNRDFFFKSDKSGTDTPKLSDFDLNDMVLERLYVLWNVVQSTEIQELTIPHILRGENVQFTSESGSGKTLAYLIPLIEAARRNKSNFTLILVPSRELVRQVSEVIDSLSFPWFERDLNVIVSTPRALLNSSWNFNDLKSIVIDEADTLLDDSFEPFIRKLLTISEKNVSRQIILSSTTMPSALEEFIDRFFPNGNLVSLRTSRVHRLATHCSHRFLRCGPSQKTDLIVKTVRKIKGPVIIFCNKMSAVSFVVHTLIENGINPELIAALGGAMPSDERDMQWEVFRSGERSIMVATDLASRGLDTSMVRHVVNFDLPRQISDYIHRVGRLGRVTSVSSKNIQFYVTNFVTYKGDVELVWKLEAAARKAAIGRFDNNELPEVDANIKRQIAEYRRDRDELAMGWRVATSNTEQQHHVPFPEKFLGLSH